MELDRCQNLNPPPSYGLGRDGLRDRSRSPEPGYASRSMDPRIHVEVAELKDKLEQTQNELRRTQAELRLNQGDYERSHVELEQMQEKVSQFFIVLNLMLKIIFSKLEKSQGEIYRLRAKLESTQTENENMADELEKMQRALNQSFSDRDRIGSELDKYRDDLERSQVLYSQDTLGQKSIFYPKIHILKIPIFTKFTFLNY